jgi:hypothetical protein
MVRTIKVPIWGDTLALPWSMIAPYLCLVSFTIKIQIYFTLVLYPCCILLGILLYRVVRSGEIWKVWESAEGLGKRGRFERVGSNFRNLPWSLFSDYLLHPTSHITYAMSSAVFTASTTRGKRPAAPMSPSLYSQSTNMPEGAQYRSLCSSPPFIPQPGHRKLSLISVTAICLK